mgnify:CR=1 FL=1
MKRFIEKILVIVALFGAMCTTLTLAPTDTYAAPNTACNHTFLGIRAWYHNLAYGSDCEIRIAESGKADGGKFATFVSTILLNILVDISSMVGFGMIAMVILQQTVFSNNGNLQGMAQLMMTGRMPKSYI